MNKLSARDLARLLAAATLLVISEYLMLVFGFADISGAALAPGAGIALVITLIWRAPGAIAVFAAYLVLSKVTFEQWNSLDAMMRALVALGSAVAMREVHRSGWDRNKLNEWLSFVALGVVAPSLICVGLKALLQVVSSEDIPAFSTQMQSALAMMISIQMVVSVTANLGELKLGVALWRQSVGITVAMMLSFIGLVALLPFFSTPGTPGLMLLLGLPVALWIAKQPYSLPGAIVTIFGATAMIWLMIDSVDEINNIQVLQTVLYLFVLIAIAQFFHAAELDRLHAMSDLARSRDALQDMVILRNAEMARMIRHSSRDTAARKRFRQTMTEKISNPLKEMMATLSQAAAETEDPAIKARMAAFEAQLAQLANETRQITNDADFKGE